MPAHKAPQAVSKVSAVEPLLQDGSRSKAVAFRGRPDRGLLGRLEATAAGALPSQDASFSEAYELGSQTFDGSVPEWDDAVLPYEEYDLPGHWLIANPEHGSALAAILAEAEKTPSGRRILRKIEKMSKRRRRKVVFEFKSMQSAHAYVDWGTHVVRISRSFLYGDAKLAAPVLIHELSHVLQKANGLPFHAMELELEAWMYTLKVARELGLKFKRGDFQFEAQRKFKGDLDEFIDWLHDAHNKQESFSILTGDREHYTEMLGLQIEKHEHRLHLHLNLLARRQATYRQMKKAQYPSEALKKYLSQEIAPVRRQLKEDEEDLKGLRKEMRVIRSRKGFQNYRDWARRVKRSLKRFHEVYDSD